MPAIFLTSLATAVCCGIWGYLAEIFLLLTWGGFAGCTTYFVSGKQKKYEGVFTALATNLSGVAWALLAFWVVAQFPTVPFISPIMTGVVTLGMGLQGSVIKFLNFTPGAFIGCFSTFAAGGDWKVIGLSLICGAVLAFVCDVSGGVLVSLFGKKARK